MVKTEYLKIQIVRKLTSGLKKTPNLINLGRKSNVQRKTWPLFCFYII